MTRRRLLLAIAALRLQAAERHAVNGVILNIDRAHRTFTASIAAIPGYMAAMVMPFPVANAKALNGFAPGDNVEFTLVVDGTRSFADGMKLRRFESMEQEPLRARRLQLLQDGAALPALKAGQTVADFTLTDQTGRDVKLSEFADKVVALSFIYTSCPLPDYCFRISNNFARLAKRFKGQNVVLLSISFDPAHDSPEVLARYARTWNADPRFWHFLTGDLTVIKAVCKGFGLNFWQDEGVLTHSLRTIVIDRNRKLAASFEGNEWTAEQLGDFVASRLRVT